MGSRVLELHLADDVVSNAQLMARWMAERTRYLKSVMHSLSGCELYMWTFSSPSCWNIKYTRVSSWVAR